MLVQVALAERSYDIEIAAGCLSRAADFLMQRRKVSHAVLIADANVAATHGAVVQTKLEAAGVRVDLFKVPAGEGSKSIGQFDQLLQQMVAFAKADRKTVVVAVGGG